MRFVILWSDLFFWLLFVASSLFFLYAVVKKPLFRQNFCRLLESRVAVICFSLLTAFFLIALTDSVHFQLKLEKTDSQNQQDNYQIEPISVLDWLLSPLGVQKETTYSAPFSLYSATKETLETSFGVVRDYPRLQYAGQHIAEDSERSADILSKSLMGAGYGLITWLVFVAVVTGLIGIISRQSPVRWAKQVFSGRSRFAIRGFLIIWLLIFLLAHTAIYLSRYYHVLGTDAVGQDVLFLSLKAIRSSLLIGTLPTLVLLPIAIWLGLIAGYFRGIADDIVQYIYTTLNSIPGILLIAAAILVMQVTIDTHTEWFQTATQRADLRLLALCVVLGATGWTTLCRLIRAESLKLRELEFVQAAKVFGVSNYTILKRHLLPNLFYIISISVVMDFSGLVLAEAVLSYVGIGVDPTMISFGTMINMARLEMARDPIVWWSLVSAFVFLVTIVLSANLLADAIYDAFDPRSRLIDRQYTQSRFTKLRCLFLAQIEKRPAQ